MFYVILITFKSKIILLETNGIVVIITNKRTKLSKNL